MSEGLKLLKTILVNNSTEKLYDIDSDIFVDGEERESYLYVVDHYKNYGVLPSISTLEDFMQMDFPRADEPTDFYLNNCLDRELFGNIRPVFSDLQTAMRQQDSETIRRVCGDLHSIANSSRGSESIMTVDELAQMVRINYDRASRTPGLQGIPTGWYSVDKETLGWQKGDLNIFVARAGSGKTNYLLHSCRHAWKKGKSVLLASMEMASSQIMNRFVAQCAGINPTHLRKGTLCDWTKRRVDAVLEGMQGDAGFHLYAGEFKGKSVEDLDKIIQEYSPDAVYVDGLYLMTSKSAPKTVSRYEKVAYVVDGLKSSALERNRPIIGTTQFNRSSGGRNSAGSLETLGFTDTLATHTSIVISIRNPHDDPSVHPPKRVFEFLKGREGEQGSVLINHTFTPLCFDEVRETKDERAERRRQEEAYAYQEATGRRRGGRNTEPQGTGATTRFTNGNS